MGPHLFLSSVITAAVFLQRLEGRMIGSLQPIAVLAGNDIILPCHLEPTADLSDQLVEWSRPGSSVTYVHVHRYGAEVLGAKEKSYNCRTELFLNELKNGNISLKLFRVKRSDEGTYKCSVPTLNIESLIELRVGMVSRPMTSIVGTKDGGVDLQCESGGCFPEPEVEWLVSEGHVLFAGPTETLRDPEGTFTVRRHVTVYQSATNRFTCRVHQQHINQTRETVIHVPDLLFLVPAWKWVIGVLGTILVISVTAIAITLYLLKKKDDATIQKYISQKKFLTTRQAALDEWQTSLRCDLEDLASKHSGIKKDLEKLEVVQTNQERITELINLLDLGDSKKEEMKELGSLIFKEDIEAQIVQRKNECVDLEQRIKRLEEIKQTLNIKNEEQVAELQQMRDELWSRLHLSPGCFGQKNKVQQFEQALRQRSSSDPSIHLLSDSLILCRVAGWVAGYTLNRSPVHHRAISVDEVSKEVAEEIPHLEIDQHD